MGKRGQQKKKAPGGGGMSADLSSELSQLFRALPPNKRRELNQLVEKLLSLCSNFSQEPSTPKQFWEEFVQIDALVQKIRTLEQCNLQRKLFLPRPDYLPAFRDWLSQHGVHADGVVVQDYQDQGLGLQTTRAMSTGEMVLTVPRKLMLSGDTARDSEIGRLVETDPMLQTMSNVALSLHLLFEKTSPASFWEPYINTLPSSYTTVLYFRPEHFQALRGSPAFEDALRQYKHVARQYAYFYRKFQATMLKDYFTYDEYRWAVSTVMTRQNQIPSSRDTNKSVNALIPFWDLANHDPNGQLSTDYDDDGEEAAAEAAAVEAAAEKESESEEKKPAAEDPEVKIKAGEDKEEEKTNAGEDKGEEKKDEKKTDCESKKSFRPFIRCLANKDFSSGDQFTIFYGGRSNHDLLIHNGFVLQDNPHNRLHIKLGVSKNDALAKSKCELLSKLVLPPQGNFPLNQLSRTTTNPIASQTLAFLRVICMHAEEEVEAWSQEDRTKLLLSASDDEAVAGDDQMKALDAKAHRYLLTRCTLLLKSYPASLEEDEKVKLDELDTEKRFCLVLCMGEKRILNETIKYCQEKCGE